MFAGEEQNFTWQRATGLCAESHLRLPCSAELAAAGAEGFSLPIQGFSLCSAPDNYFYAVI